MMQVIQPTRYQNGGIHGYYDQQEPQPNMNAQLNKYFHKNVQLALDESNKLKELAFANVKKIFAYINERDPRFSKDPIKAGSYWQGLKVDKADEYDYSVKVQGFGRFSWTAAKERYYGFDKLEANTDTLSQDLEIVNMDIPLPPAPTGYCFSSVSAPYSWDRKDDLIRNGDLVPFLVKRRLKELLTDAKRDLNLRGSVRQSRKAHGPALTLYFKAGEKEISVDFAPLVPCQLPFPNWLGWPRKTKWPNQTKINEIKQIGISEVAKKDFYWMYSFVEAEKVLVEGIDADQGKRKEVHRIMKKLNQDVWCNTPKPVISSYVLKNIWFWEIEKYPETYHWDNDHLWTRLENMTRELLSSIQNRQLKQYFFPDFNLLKSKDPEELDIAARKIEDFLADPCSYLEVD